eukprot:11982420-Prorocentrum_lima.AAC.1
MLALCLLRHPHHWRSEEMVRNEMESEGHTDFHIASTLAMIRAHVSVIDGVNAGSILIPPEQVITGHDIGEELPDLDRRQATFVRTVTTLVAKA